MSLVLTPQSMKEKDMLESDWSEACLVTPHHSVRQHWNDAALRHWCSQTGRQILVCTAEDTVSAKKTSMPAQIVGKEENIHRQRKTPPKRIEIAVGMKVMVTENLETDLDITNGAQGEITTIVLHPDEPPLSDDSVVLLRYLPAYILVKLEKTKVANLPGLEAGVIPVEPRIVNMKFTVDVRGEICQRSGKRRQIPITAAYAFTDYRAQGQTIQRLIVDIARPPHGTLSLFNLYVALSRSSGRSTIQLLRDFDESVLRQSHNLNLLAEDDRIDTLDRATRMRWNRASASVLA